MDLESEASTAGSTGKTVHYRNRQSRRLVAERAPGVDVLRWLYGTVLGRQCLRTLTHYSLASNLCGWWQKLSFSRRDIHTFIRQYGVDMSEAECPVDSYSNFNAFFTRTLKKDARPFDTEPEILCCPADGKVLVYNRLGADAVLPIKGQHVRVDMLVACRETATRYTQGSALVVRLAPYDYHRYHFFDTGHAGPANTINGQYHSVNPIALAQNPIIFALNKRAITTVDSATFGAVCCIEIGALNVSSIVQTYAPGPVQRGQEKGFFQFGGSTLVLLFPANTVTFDEDLLADSATGTEVHVRAGERVSQRV